MPSDVVWKTITDSDHIVYDISQVASPNENLTCNECVE